MQCNIAKDVQIELQLRLEEYHLNMLVLLYSALPISQEVVLGGFALL